MKLYMTQADTGWEIRDRATGELQHACLLADALSNDDIARSQAVRYLLDNDETWPAIVAAASDDPDTQFVPWESDPAIGYEGEADDGRIFDPGCFSFRDFPMALLSQTETSWGHDGAHLVGRVDQASVVGGAIPASGVFANDEDGLAAAKAVNDGMMCGVSMDAAGIEIFEEIVEQDDDGYPLAWALHYTQWEMAALTILAIPAFGKARIKVSDPALLQEETAELEPLAASAAIVTDPPVSWFDDPAFTEPTAMTFGSDGQVRGHIATWGTCHIGMQGSCVQPPHSASAYTFYTNGYVECDEGCHVPTGVITLGGGHADKSLNAAAAKKHYDETGLGVADVAVGEDEYGIWVAGALRPTVTSEQLRELRACPPSGDWRSINGQLEMIALAAVNVPGFPVPRVSVAASGEIMSLVAAVGPRPAKKQLSGDAWKTNIERRLERAERSLSTLRPTIVDALAQRVHLTP